MTQLDSVGEDGGATSQSATIESLSFERSAAMSECETEVWSNRKWGGMDVDFRKFEVRNNGVLSLFSLLLSSLSRCISRSHHLSARRATRAEIRWKARISKFITHRARVLSFFEGFLSSGTGPATRVTGKVSYTRCETLRLTRRTRSAIRSVSLHFNRPRVPLSHLPDPLVSCS